MAFRKQPFHQAGRWSAYISSIAAAPSMTTHDTAAPATASLAPLFVELVELLLPANHKHHVM